MKRLFVSLLVAVFAAPLLAGVTYDFSNVTSGKGGSEMSGKAAIEGASSRMDFVRGDRVLIPDGSVVISNDGGKTLIVINPKKKSYYKLELEGMMKGAAGAMQGMGGVMQMKISNESVDVRENGAGGDIEGFPTSKYTVTTTYDMSMKIMGMKNDQNIRMVSEIWATEKLPVDYMTFVQQKGLKTGMADLDRLIAKQSAAMKGFPLKQIMTTTSTAANGKAQTTVMTLTVTNIAKATIGADQFEIPAGYKQEAGPLAGLEALQKKQ
jgi:hypothetical protein